MQHYEEHYREARNNKKLRSALEQAEQHLKQNDQDVSFY